MKWLWQNTTQVGFGVNAVKDHLSKFIQPKSKVLCTFGGGSIDKNGCRSDVNEALQSLECEVRWEGGIPANPEYERLMEIVNVVRDFQPTILLAVGGGSVIDGTKFICCASTLSSNEDAWDFVMVKHKEPKTVLKFGTVLTIPATGSEWNNGFVISRRETGWKIESAFLSTYPLFSLIDPRYTMTLPIRQLRNGVFDGFTHVIDQLLYPTEHPMFDDFFFSILRELVEIGPEVIKENSSLELHERLIVACSFALNYIFSFGKEAYWETHVIGHQLTAKYGIDHGATLAMVMPTLLESQIDQRKEIYAKTAEEVFGVKDGTLEQKAVALIDHIRKFIKILGLPETVGQWEGVKIGGNDVDEVTENIFIQSTDGKPFGYKDCCTKEVVHKILEKVII